MPRPSPAVLSGELAGYRLSERLGAGGFAVVWAAARERDGAAVAVKVGRADAPALVERFRREAEAMGLIGPPHVPALYEHGRLPDGAPYIVMERLSGEPLSTFLARQPGPLPQAEVARIGDGVLAALEAAHARGVAHRDLKPGNVFLADGGARVVLLDFGLVKRLEAQEPELTRSGVVVGTPEYMAPEQIRGERDLGAPADLYAFGVLLFELVTLRVPFTGERSAIEHGHVTLRPPRPSDLVKVAPPLEELILACLAKQPERRPAGAAILRRALAEACAAAPPATHRASPSQASPSRGARLIGEGRHPVVLAAIDADDAMAAQSAVAERGGIIARQRGHRCVAVFSGLDVEDPARAALATARSLVTSQPGARAALHVASVTLRRRDGARPAAFGAEIERPEAWMPAEPWSGVHITPALAETLAGAERSSESAARLPLAGRDAELGRLTASMNIAFADARPALLTVLGEPGLGKSRIAAEAADIARAARRDALIIPLRAQPTATATGAPLSRELLIALGEDGSDAAGPDRVRRLADALQRRARNGPVAVILDDAHSAEDELLDALEYATLDGHDLPLWVVVAANPRLERVRRGWGSRTRYRERLVLTPLDERPAMQLAAELLKPAEYPPAGVLERLARWSAGNPEALAEIVRALKRAGAVRRRPSTSSYHVITAQIEALPASPAWQWLAARRLGALSPELAACLRLCSVLGAAFSQDEVERIQDALERAGKAATPVDAGVGLRILVAEGLLRRGADGRHAFAGEALQEGIYALVEAAQRAEIHEEAHAYWQARAGEGATVEALEALARHATARGLREEAADAELRLGELASRKHGHVEADRRYTAALELAADDDARRRAAALAGRGRSRYRIGRGREAVDDLVEARRLYDTLGDQPASVEALLEQATALDWIRQYHESARCMEEARPLVEALGTPGPRLRHMVAEGRTSWRRGDNPRSIELLRAASALAQELNDNESQVIALGMLGFQLAVTEQLDEAEARFEHLIRLASSAHDQGHLAMAYANRVVLWHARRDLERGIDDLRRAVELVRECGQPLLERALAANWAELLFHFERHEEALEVTHRIQLIEERFFEQPAALGAIWHARILLAMGDLEAACPVIAGLEAIESPELTEPSEQRDAFDALSRMLRLVRREVEGHAGGAELASAWDEVTGLAETLDDDWFLEVVHWRVRMAMQARRRDEASRALDRARARLDRSKKWSPRLSALESRLATHDVTPVP